jgi:flap endonuclease-1
LAVALGKLVASVKEQISLGDVSGKTIAIDAYNTIYQFLSIIRQPDGTPLTDSRGRVTSHLSGLLYRTMNLLEYRITPVYVFDGLPPLLKRRTLEARANRRESARKEWEAAKAAGQMEQARSHAMASTRITKEVTESAKALLGMMGIPCIQAPSEGEAQAAVMASKGLVYASASQDYDSFLFGANVVLRNMATSGRRKLPGKNVYVDIQPERIMLDSLLQGLGITRRQLIMLGMLMGTDFNTGIDKVGPKTALKIVKENPDLDGVVRYVKSKYNAEFDSDPCEVEQIFMKPECDDISEESFRKLVAGQRPDKEAITRFMCDEHGFSVDRVTKVADKLEEIRGAKGQKGMAAWM